MTMLMQNLNRGGGGGGAGWANKVYYGRCENGELEKTPREPGVEDK